MAGTLPCPACGNPSRDGALCAQDTERLQHTLTHAPGLLAELQTQAARLNVSASNGGRAAEKPLPIDLRAADLAAGYEALLTSWARALGAEADPRPPVGGADAARWMGARIPTIRQHEAAGDAVEELTEHATACYRAIDHHSGDQVYIGDCTALLPPNDIECRTPLRVKAGSAEAVCWRCEAAYDVPEMLARRDAVIDASLATAREIAAAGFRNPEGRVITLRMIEGYVERHIIFARGSKRNAALNRDAAMYSIAEVKEAAIRVKPPKLKATPGKGRCTA